MTSVQFFCAEVTSRIHIIYEMGTFIDTVAIVRDNIHEGMNGVLQTKVNS